MSRWLLLVIKVSVSVALIAILVRRTDLSQVWAVVAQADRTLLSAAFMMFYLGYSIAAARWRLLLRVLGATVSFWYLFRSFMVSVFFNNFLPSTVGGDAMRMYDSWRTGVSKTNAVTVVLIDRLLGLTALLLFALCGLAFGVQSNFGASNALLVLGVSVASVLGILLGLVFLPNAAAAVTSKMARLVPIRVAGVLDRVRAALHSFAGRRDVLTSTLLLSVALQANVIAYHWLVAEAFGLDVSLTAFLLIVPVALLVMMLPISINGIGVRESAFVLLLGTQGVGQAESLAYAWLVYAFLLIQGLIGGLVFALRSEKHRGASGKNSEEPGR